MMRHTLTIALTLALMAAPTLASAGDMTMDMGKSANPADKAFMDGMHKMMTTMAMKPTGNTDKDFVLMMIPHHQGAIDMAKVELQYGSDPLLRKLATDIVKAQETEIADMKAWLAQHPK